MAFASIPYVSCLVNGRGRYLDGPDVPLTNYDVSTGDTVRLRLINGSSTYPFTFSIDDHDFTVITADGQPVKPVKGDALMINVGLGYDVLVEATGDGLNWMRYKPFGPPVDGPEGRSVLRYKGTEGSEPAESAGATPSAQIDVMKLRSLDSTDLSGEKPREIEMVLGGGPQGKSTATPYRWSIGDQYWPSSEQYVVDEGENIRFVLTNPTPMPHPFHLHGHSFNVLGDPAGPILQSPVLRDTVTVPPSGAIAVQVAADNPGKWIWHCHIDWHLATGMARVVRYSSIDDLESRQFPKGTLT
jgi:FtsP/CotA-like multicopper oxidase with cupredoxin domain